MSYHCMYLSYFSCGVPFLGPTCLVLGIVIVVVGSVLIKAYTTLSQPHFIMHLQTNLLLSLLTPFLIYAIALPQPADLSSAPNIALQPHKVIRQEPSLESADPDLDIDIPDGGVPKSPGAPVRGIFTKPSFVPSPDDNILPFPNSVAYCPNGTAYCCESYPPTGGTLCKFNGDGHLANCEISDGSHSVCCSKENFGCKGMSGLKTPITTN
ncbi:hypothetical protein ACMFMG_008218 [Clarireedia jacksonii]